MSFFKKLKSIFTTKRNFDDNFFEELEEILIEADLGSSLTYELSEELKKMVKKEKIKDSEDAIKILEDKIKTYLREYRIKIESKPKIILVLGVNGVGKTTTCAKIAKYYLNKGLKATLVAADTFRAAAIDQLNIHAEKLGVRIVKQNHGSDPAAVVYDAIISGQSRGDDVLIIDTAGRLESKAHLLKELAKIDKVIKKLLGETHYERILVLDSTTGQNTIHQAQTFNEYIPLDALILAKTDSMAKAGFLVQIGKKLNLPILFDCFGEGYNHIKDFDKDEYTKKVLDR